MSTGKANNVLYAILVTLFISLFSSHIRAQPYKLALVDKNILSHFATDYHGEQVLFSFYESLLLQADQILEKKIVSVTDKKALPPSANPQDYFSLALYWWPDPQKVDGLPYIRRDGYRNPEVDSTDSRKLWDMSDRVLVLTKAFYITQNEEYLAYLLRQIDTWFVSESTRMNPHLKYAQSIPGRVDGRHWGVIDTHHLSKVPQAISLISEIITIEEEILSGVQEWFGEFNNWLINSDFGIKEAASRNNHSTWFYVQVMAYEVFLGYKNENTINKAIASLERQLEENGAQPYELERQRPFAYAIFNMRAVMQLYHLSGDKAFLDFFERMLAYLDTYISYDKSWPYSISDQPQKESILQLVCFSGNLTSKDIRPLNTIDIYRNQCRQMYQYITLY